MSLEAELRATSDALLAMLDRLAALEEEKRTLPLEDPRFVELADAIERLAREVLEEAAIERELAEPAHARAVSDTEDAPSRPIESIPRSPHTILDEWRAAERALAQAEPGSVEAKEASLRVRHLRAEYGRAYQDVLESGPDRASH